MAVWFFLSAFPAVIRGVERLRCGETIPIHHTLQENSVRNEAISCFYEGESRERFSCDMPTSRHFSPRAAARKPSVSHRRDGQRRKADSRETRAGRGTYSAHCTPESSGLARLARHVGLATGLLNFFPLVKPPLSKKKACASCEGLSLSASSAG